MIGFQGRLLARYSRLYPLSLFLITRPLAVAAAFELSVNTFSRPSTSSNAGSRSFLTNRHHPNSRSFSTALAMSAPQRFPATAATSLTFGADVTGPDEDYYNATVLLGRKSSLEQLAASTVKDKLGLSLDSSILTSLLADIDEKSGGSATTLLAGGHRLTLCGLTSPKSRSLSSLGLHTIPPVVKSNVQKKGNTRLLVLLPDEMTSIGPLALAVSKAFPVFSLKTSSTPAPERTVHVSFLTNQGGLVDDMEQFQAAQAVAEGVRWTGRLVDMHPELLTTTQFLKEAQTVADQCEHVRLTEIVGDDLKSYGGLYNVGKAAECPPRLVILEYTPPQYDETVALVGKGIVYDTGGLSLKSRDGMSGMKGDMGGAAGMLGGFYAACKLKVSKKLVLLLCLAENAIGPTAFRNDDILTMYSGKTVEVNNPDAEGRLVLADGVAHATRHVEGLDLVVDMATLTGAQLITTGKKHAGILANSKELEERAIAAGLNSGDYVFQMLYCPELLVDEFKSEVADMKNSVKDRSNAQASCAGHFIESHLHEDYKGGWLHVDMAGPAWKEDRGTGYGVGLVLSLLNAPGW